MESASEEKPRFDYPKIIKISVLMVVALILIPIPSPRDLPMVAWRLLGVYISTILGLILKPYKEPIVLFIGVVISAFVIIITPNELVKAKDVLNGYANSTVWLVFSAFSLSAGFVHTGLGRRIAYILIGKIGNTTLRLGYMNLLLDLFLSPATPSNTARAGGIITPIISSVSLALGSEPYVNPELAGSFLMINIYMITKTTSYLFLTAMAPNAMAVSLVGPVLDLNINFYQWFLAAFVPGSICLAMTPLLLYWFLRPELKTVNNKEIASEGLQELGPMKTSEKVLLIIFFSALAGWIFGGLLGTFKIPLWVVAVTAMTLLLVVNVINWDVFVKNKGAWATLMWYGGIIGLAKVLEKAKFFIWLAEILEDTLEGVHLGGSYFSLIFLIFITVAIRYVFASGSAYIAAMMPVFALLGKTIGAEPKLLMLGMLFSNSYGGMLTHYTGGAGPIVFVYGYANIKSWWIPGAILAMINYITHMTIGVLWWKFLIAYNIILS